MTDEQHDSENFVEVPVVRDRRRVDPETGELREVPENMSAHSADMDAETLDGPPSETPPSDSSESRGSNGDDALAQARAEAAERLDDLKRLQAEFVNYRRRVERDREAVRESAKVEVLSDLLAVLDDIGRAREHGDLTGAFRSVGEAVEAVAAKAGLEQYGEEGDEFDPTIHEAFMHGYADDVKVPTCTQILQPGYRVGDRIVRAARVAVAEPTEAFPEQEQGASDVDAEAAGDSTEGSKEEE